ncbi:signal peptidase I [Thermoproteota archaeon]
MDENTKEILRYGATLITLIAIFYGGTIVLRNSLGTSNPMMVVISQSMVPTLGVGDFIFIEAITDFDQVTIGDLPNGDILVFIRPGYHEEYIVHRAISGYETEAGWVYQTKGDNNAFPDGFQVTENLIVGRVINRLPVIGYFSLFIKTMKGFGLVLVLMGISFFYDNILPNKPEKQENGKFNKIVLIPFAIAPIVLIKLLIQPRNHQTLETITLITWYLGCLLLPLTTDDDDMGLMFWLYHLVLLMIPIACDLVWWTTGITPSQWWRTQGSIVPVSWLLMEETILFNQSFNLILFWLGPGILIFLGLIYAKRRPVAPVKALSEKIRSL